MNSIRLEAFSDGFFAIIITIMVLELQTPHTPGWNDLVERLPEALRYLLSFLYIGLYWVNHHALFHGRQRVSTPLLWANLHLLFWLSLIPFVTAWAGQFPYATVPVASYGCVLLMCALGYALVATVAEGWHTVWHQPRYFGSISLYALATLIALWHPLSASAIHAVVALFWLRPPASIAKCG